MRALGTLGQQKPFEQINSEQLVKQIYSMYVNPIDEAEPKDFTVPLERGQVRTFSVKMPQPMTHALAIKWEVDGTVLGKSAEFLLPPGLRPGSHTVVVTVFDPTAFVHPDSDRTMLSQIHTWEVVVKPGNVDLVVTRVSSDPPSPLLPPGGSFQARDEVKNAVEPDGGASAGPSTTLYYLSTEPLGNPRQVSLNGSRAVHLLTPGAKDAGAVRVTIPLGTAPGSYFLVACADDGPTDHKGVVVEANEGNNCSARVGAPIVRVEAQEVKPPEELPDLIVTLTSSDPPAPVLPPGGSFQVRDTVKNNVDVVGADAGRSTTRYYLSTDGRRRENRLSGSREVPAIPYGSDNSGGVTVTIPPGTAPGSYFLLACADDRGNVKEARENNNCTPSATKVRIELPDYVVLAVVNETPTVARGGKFSIADTVYNGGEAPALLKTRTLYYLSTDPTRNSREVPLTTLNPTDVRPLGSREPLGENHFVQVPSDTRPGDYFVMACADDTPGNHNGVVVERDETNNCNKVEKTIGFPTITITP
jgi:hypothetical protein